MIWSMCAHPRGDRINWVPSVGIGCGHQPSLQTPGLRLGEGMGMERGQRAEERGFLFYKQGKLHPGLREGRGVGKKCGKGMMSVVTLSYHWWEKEEGGLLSCLSHSPRSQACEQLSCPVAGGRAQSLPLVCSLEAGRFKNLSDGLENH